MAKDAKVFIDGKVAQFNGLATEALVVVKLSGDHKEIGMIQTEGPSVQGILVAADSEKNVITLTTPKKGEPTGDEFTYPVAKNAKVVIYGREAKFKDLAQGALVTAKLSSDRKFKICVSRSSTGKRFSVTASGEGMALDELLHAPPPFFFQVFVIFELGLAHRAGLG